MNAVGFYIKKLKVTGKNKPVAEITFERGGNVICGASDTGKSYILSALYHGLGKSEKPKEIPESQGYDNLYIEIREYANDTPHVLFRKIGTSNIHVKKCELEDYFTSKEEPRILKVKSNQNDEDTISQYLLRLCKLDNKKVLTSKSTRKTEFLSFKNLIDFFFVKEDKILKEGSPFYPSDQYTKRTLEQSTLRTLLTGRDYSDEKEIEDQLNKQINLNAKIDFINRKIAKDSSKLEELEKEIYNSPFEVNSDYYFQLKKSLDETIEKIVILSDQKSKNLEKLNELKQSLTYDTELLKKFKILNDQYLSDLERLRFILEAESYTSQLGHGICPVCGNDIKEDHLKHLNEIDNFKELVSIEANKVRTKLYDLQKTIEAKEQSIVVIKNDISLTQVEVEKIDLEISSNYEAKAETLKGDMDSILSISQKYNQIEFLKEEIARLYSERMKFENLKNQKKDKSESTSIVEEYILHELSKHIEKRLKEWKFETNPRVSFNSEFKIFDIIVSGKSRKSFGKGKRSVLYAACLLGVLDYCLIENKSNLNTIILDSPLTTFKSKGETLQQLLNKLDPDIVKIKDRFFKSLSNYQDRSQIIVFDNVIPRKKELYDILNVEIFTDYEKHGRQGFFPTKDD